MLRNLLQLLAEDGVLQPIGNQWLWRTDVTLPRPEDIWSSLISDYPEYALTHRAGRVPQDCTSPNGCARARTRVSPKGATDTVSAWADGCTQQEAAEVAEALADMHSRRGRRPAGRCSPARAAFRRRLARGGPGVGAAARCGSLRSRRSAPRPRPRWTICAAAGLRSTRCHVRSLILDRELAGGRQPSAVASTSWCSARAWPTRRTRAPPAERAPSAARRRPAGSARDACIACRRSDLRPGAALVGTAARPTHGPIALVRSGNLARSAGAAQDLKRSRPCTTCRNAPSGSLSC